MKKILYIRLIVILLSTCIATRLIGQQCTQQVTHLSGSQQIGCTEVTVTSDGSVSTIDICNQAPYWIGFGSITGSYFFTFSPPVSGVSLGLSAINNQPAINNYEEIRFEINGVFYPVTIPGTAGTCFPLAIITQTGTVTGPVGQIGEWDNMDINTSISTLKVENVVFSGAPNGTVFSLFICPSCCQTNAGTITANALNLCVGQQATVPASDGVVLDNNDILRYILFSNPNDTLGSIIATSTSPTFSFNPAMMQLGTTYYIAAIAGNNQNGNVDLNDPCLDISNAIPVMWRGLPSVTFSIANPNVCAGTCTDITASLTGSPPFVLTYTTQGSGLLTQNFTSNTGTFQVCAPAGAPAGSFQIAATKVVDAWCTCE